tara:strand:+ start:307 stop:588 length:282 start_codon:yes stop_codon:yes gene_type:complete
MKKEKIKYKYVRNNMPIGRANHWYGGAIRDCFIGCEFTQKQWKKKFMKIVKYVRPELKLTGHFRKRDTTWNIQFREGYIVTADDFRKNGGWFI